MVLRDVIVRIGPNTLLDRVSLEVGRGELLAVVGPNGAGKSTLASVMAGDLRPDEGEVLLDDTPLAELGVRELARRRAVLPQDYRVTFPFRAEQVIMMGRSPHLRRGQSPGRSDRAAVAAALAATETTHLAARPVPTLSGGEQARVSLARVLAQDAPTVILDEPLAALDLRHQQQILGLCLAMAAEGRAVVVIVHDLNQAATAHRVAVVDQGRVIAVGPPGEVLTATTVARVFDLSVTVAAHPSDGGPVVLPDRSPPRARTRSSVHPPPQEET
jgi:iron complex transport system ATP-binding protein